MAGSSALALTSLGALLGPHPVLFFFFFSGSESPLTAARIFSATNLQASTISHTMTVASRPQRQASPPPPLLLLLLLAVFLSLSLCLSVLLWLSDTPAPRSSSS